MKDLERISNRMAGRLWLTAPVMVLATWALAQGAEQDPHTPEARVIRFDPFTGVRLDAIREVAPSAQTCAAWMHHCACVMHALLPVSDAAIFSLQTQTLSDVPVGLDVQGSGLNGRLDPARSSWQPSAP